MVKTSEMSMELKQELAFTKEELAELEAAKKMPITFDADCPETTPERAVKFRRVNPPRNRMDVLMIVGAIYHQIGNPTKMVSYSSMLSRLAAMTGREAGIMYNKLRKLENA